MAISFTPQQQKVIDVHGSNVLVSAAAGSGKTAVLVERIIQMVCREHNPVDIDRLLIVTFTNAAAAEMRERIANGISERLLEHPESEHIQKQATLLHNAQITTIDSFSLFILRNHFNEIGLDPAFRVADEGEMKLMQGEVLSGLLEDAYASGDEAFRYCVEYFCPGGRESVLEQHILNLSRMAASYPFPAEWLQQRKQDYEAEGVDALCTSDYGCYLEEHVKKILSGCVDKMRLVQSICEQPDGPYMYGELVDGELEAIEKLNCCTTLQEYAIKLSTVVFGRLPSKKDESVTPYKREQAKNLRSEVKETIQELSGLFFATPLELAATQAAACREPVNTMIDLVLEFDRRMSAAKQEKKLIDFSDMEHFALNILVHKEGETIVPTPVALEYRQYFKEILIDEYQDSNLVQEYLLKAVSGEEDGAFNRFMVGDVKQSIYKFRLARPELFLEKYDNYTEEGDCRRIDLSMNFRSRAQVVDTVNAVFGSIMSRQIGGIAYDDKACLYAGAVYPDNAECKSELVLVEKPGGAEKLSARQAEGYAIAAKIRELHTSFQVTDKHTGQLRPVKYSDMVILLRTNSGWDEDFKGILEEQGIPVYIASKTGYFSATEVQELLQLLRVLDNPRQDIPLYGVMKSVFGGFTEEEIALIRAQHRNCSLYEALCEMAGNTEDKESHLEKALEVKSVSENLEAKTRGFLQEIDRYRDCTVYLPIRELLQKLVTDFDYLNYVTALPAGSKRRANVEMLFTKASDFEKTSYFGLFHFIRYMEQLEKYDVDYGEADILDENADVVRIMSIHKSKGLEFPVTFVSGLSKRFNMQDANQSLIMDMDMGLAIDYVNPEMRIRNKTLRRLVLARKLREDNLSEELRVLYVALTRAKEKLIMTASLDKAGEKWEQRREEAPRQLTYLDFIEAGSYLDLLLPVLNLETVQVSVFDAASRGEENLREQLGMYDRQSALNSAASYADEQALIKLRERLHFIYPYEKLARLYTKTTVSELKIAAMAQKDEAAYHAFEEKEIVPYIPRFRMQEEKVSGSVRGNAFHRTMELLDFDQVLGGRFPEIPDTYEIYAATFGEKEIRGILHAFLVQENKELRLTDEYFQALNEVKIVHFLKTELAFRMWKAEKRGQLYREQPFVLGVEASRLGEGFPEDESLLIQGIIDAFFVEEKGIVLLDYKTDVIGSMSDLWNRYQVQLQYYEEALQRLMQLPVKEKRLYSFYLEE